MKYFTKKNRAILREMVATDFKVRYQGSVLGYLWSLLRPIFQFTILYIVFVNIFKLNRSVEFFPAYLFLGIVLWNFFTEATSTGMTAIVSNGDLIRKISIPRFLVVLSTSISALINLTLNFIVVVVIALIVGVKPHMSWLLIVPILIELFIFSQAMAFFLAAFFVKFRDINYIWEVLTQAAFYATPILYALTMVPEQYRKFIMINPMAQIIQDARHVFITSKSALTGWQVMPLRYAIIPIVVVVVAVIVAVIYFKQQSKEFAENL